MLDKPISPLRQRMIDDMTARRFKEKVQKDYVRHVRNFTVFLGRSPDTATSEELRRYQLHLAKQQISPGSINAAIAALRFFFTVTLWVPFVFAANGRSYLKQIETESGIWFRDTRRTANHRRALIDWPTPEGLSGQLEVDQDAATASLKVQPFDFGFPLRPYQRDAIMAVEQARGPGRQSSQSPCFTGCSRPSAFAAYALLWIVAPWAIRLKASSQQRRLCPVRPSPRSSA